MLTPKDYKNRLIDEKINKILNIYGAVCVEGPKWCGKTWTSRNHAKNAIYIGNPAGNFKNQMLAETDPSLVLEGEKPVLIDEWQVVPSIWDAVRYAVDMDQTKGQYILTGSSTPTMKGKLHGGSGRIGKIKMRTMSLFESEKSTGDISLLGLFNNEFHAKALKEVSIDELIEYVVKGGWPGAQKLSTNAVMKIVADYLDNITDDMERMDGKKRDVRKTKALLRALGRAESNMTSKKNLMQDIEEFTDDKIENLSLTANTVTDYLDCFNRLFLIEDQPAFENKLRSSIKALKKPKRHYADPSLAVAAIGATPKMLRRDLNTFGYLFEALCIRDLRVYSDCINGKVYHYRDEKNREIDAIVQLEDGRWGMFEIKLGFNQVEDAAQELLALEQIFERETGSKPEFLCVICGLINAAYQRPDGVFVIPITALRD